MRTLLVGEGNFSFARALVRLFDGNGFGLTATAYDTREVCLAKYDDAADILQEVRGLALHPSSRERDSMRRRRRFGHARVASWENTEAWVSRSQAGEDPWAVGWSGGCELAFGREQCQLSVGLEVAVLPANPLVG